MLVVLESKGWIERTRHEARGIVVYDDEGDDASQSLYGQPFSAQPPHAGPFAALATATPPPQCTLELLACARAFDADATAAAAADVLLHVRPACGGIARTFARLRTGPHAPHGCYACAG